MLVIFLNKIILFMSLFSVICFLKDDVSKNSGQLLVLILFSSAILLNPRLCYSLEISCSGDIEVNPGPNHKPNEVLSIYHWNLNNISAYNCTKLHLLHPFMTSHKFDIICIPETNLDSSIPSDADKLEILSYNLIHSDYLSNCKRRGVCNYYKFSSIRACNIRLIITTLHSRGLEL